MNFWMTPARCEIAHRYRYDLINSFINDPDTAIHKDSESTPPSVSFYSPGFDYLLRTICEQDSYAIKHSDLKMLYYHSSEKYDIDGHCVRPFNGSIEINIDGVVFDQTEIDEFIRGYKKGLEEDKTNKANKFHVRLPK